jgi:hypothetical protein
MKTAVIVLSDPGNGDEALGRVFNALAFAYDLKQRKQHVEVLFQGAGTRWAAQLTSVDHPVHGLYKAVEDTIVGASSACSDFFGARLDAERSGFDLVSENKVPGTSGLPSLARLAAEGYTVLTF